MSEQKELEVKMIADERELERVVRAARKVAVAANILSKRRIPAQIEELEDWRVVEILLVLMREGGGASVTRVVNSTGMASPHVLAYAKKMEEKGLVRVVETPSQTFITLTQQGRKAAEDLIKALG